MDKRGFVLAVEVILRDRVTKQNKVTLEKLGRTFGIIDKNLVKELTELAIVQEARRLAHSPGAIVARYQSIVALYHNQVNLSHRTSESMLLQQYSTPAPIGYLMGMYCGIDQFNGKERALEPSAGNGLLTVAGSPSNFHVNEISFQRYKN